MRKVLLLSLVVVGHSIASESSGEGSILLWKTVNTVVLLGIVAFFGGKYIKKFLNDRRNSVADMVLQAQKAKEDSEKALEEAKRKLEESKYKLEESIKIAKEMAEAERNQAISKANEIAERIKLQAKESINIEIRRAELKLKKYAAEKAIEISKHLIENSVDEELNKSIIRKTLKNLEA